VYREGITIFGDAILGLLRRRDTKKQRKQKIGTGSSAVIAEGGCIIARCDDNCDGGQDTNDVDDNDDDGKDDGEEEEKDEGPVLVLPGGRVQRGCLIQKVCLLAAIYSLLPPSCHVDRECPCCYEERSADAVCSLLLVVCCLLPAASSLL
jgi:hypothetical protein